MEKLRFSDGSNTLVFVKEKNGKYSFEIENNPDLTRKVLANVKQKKVSLKSIKYCTDAIFKMIRENKFPELDDLDYVSLVMRELDRLRLTPEERSLYLQEENVVVSSKGVSYFVEFCGKRYKATANNKKLAKQWAFKEIYKDQMA